MTDNDAERLLLIRLVSDVFRLREVIYRSEQDTLLREGENPVEFNYIIDTPVFQYFAEPARLAHYVSALPILQVPENDDDVGYSSEGGENAAYASEVDTARKTFEPGLAQPVRQANAVLTIEYIFGALTSGSILISPDHVREVTAYIAKAELEAARGAIAEESRRSPSPAQHKPGGYLELRQLLTEVQRTMQARKRGPEDAIDDLNRSIINVLRRAAHMAAVARIDELMARNVIANAASHPAYVQDIVAPDPRYVSEWVRRVRLAKRNNKKQPSEVALEADGAALAQLSLLNKDWKSNRRVFILITDDHGLHNAYKTWLHEERSNMDNPVEHFHPLRYCKQFAPILNIKDMGGVYDSGDTFADIRRAVFQFADTFVTGDAPLNHANGQDLLDASHVPSSSEIGDWLKNQFRLAADAGSTQSEGLPARVRDLEVGISEISAKWIEAMKLVVVAKADVLIEFADQQLEFWREQLRQMEFDYAFRANIGRLTQAFDKSTTASTMLRHEFYAIEMAPHADDGLADHGRRIVASTFSAFRTEAFQGQTIDTLTSRVSKHKNPLEFLASAQTEERLLVLGALCLEIGAWRGAVSLLTAAEERVKWLPASQQHTAAVADEIEFFRCVARRVAANHVTWFREYRELADILDAALERHPNDVAGARVMSERFALSVSRFAWALPAYEAEAASVATARLKEIWEGSVGEALRGRDNRPIWQRLRSQICLNILVLAFWSVQASGSLDPTLAEAVEFSLGEVEHPERDPSHNALHLPIYPSLVRFALSKDDSVRRDLAQILIAQFDGVLEQDRERGYAFEVANVDKAEFRKIRAILVKAVGPDAAN